MNDLTKGIILTNTDYKENDAMIKVLTDDYGLLTFVAKGVKKPNSKNAMSLLPYSLSEFIFDYKDNKDIFSLHRANLIKSYYHENIYNLLALQLISNIILQAYSLYDYKLLYKELNEVLNVIDNDNTIEVIALFLTKMSEHLGFKMNVDSCVFCASKKVVSFSSLDGGFLCIDHLSNNEVIEVDRLRKIRLINKINYDKLNVLKDYNYDYIDLKIIADFFYNHSEFNDKAYKLYASMIKK